MSGTLKEAKVWVIKDEFGFYRGLNLDRFGLEYREDLRDARFFKTKQEAKNFARNGEEVALVILREKKPRKED